jgi:catechol 2,3-dioxygenase-like lactoylglutathione lyase family enzyme
MTDIDNINHVGLVVRDLHATVTSYEALGFQLTPFSAHSGAWKPGEPVQRFGSGNRCVMFANNYLEILASENKQQQAPRLAHHLRRHQGAHIICFNTEATPVVDGRLRGLGISTSGVIPLQRDIDTPEGVRTAKFERVQFAPDDSPEGYIQAARHLTPQYIYQPRYTEHPNGCTALSEVFIATDDPRAFAEKYARYLSMPAAETDGAFRFQLPLGSALTILPATQAPRSFPGSLLPPLPAIVAVSFATSDLPALRSRLDHSGFSLFEAGDRVGVPAEEASGVVVMFEKRP